MTSLAERRGFRGAFLRVPCLGAAAASRERVFDLARVGERQPDDAGRLPAIADSVDLATGRCRDETGVPVAPTDRRTPGGAYPATYGVAGSSARASRTVSCPAFCTSMVRCAP